LNAASYDLLQSVARAFHAVDVYAESRGYGGRTCEIDSGPTCSYLRVMRAYPHAHTTPPGVIAIKRTWRECFWIFGHST
jgi:hypothetical protein